MEFGSVLTAIDFKKYSIGELLAPVDFLHGKFKQIRRSENEKVTADWLMGQIHRPALGNVELCALKAEIENKIRNHR
jgi:glutamyl-tRNA(Gln) amidotransferase subunit E